MLFRDEALVVGPSWRLVLHEKRLACVECFTTEDRLERCVQCNFPLCRICLAGKGDTFWHATVECQHLRGVKFSANNDDEAELLRQIACLLPLRYLLLRRSFGDIDLCESGGRLAKDHASVAHCLAADFGVEEESATAAVRLMKANAKSVKDGRGSALYRRFSLVNHSCLSNCKTLVGACDSLTVFGLEARSTRNIR